MLLELWKYTNKRVDNDVAFIPLCLHIIYMRVISMHTSTYAIIFIIIIGRVAVS